jgi:hypothetical protein
MRKDNHFIGAVSIKDILEELNKKDTPEVDPILIVPPEYYSRLDFFSRKGANELPLYYPKVNHKIILTGDPDKELDNPRLYYILSAELKALKEYI